MYDSLIPFQATLDTIAYHYYKHMMYYKPTPLGPLQLKVLV